jgi:uncharacterized protein (TIGR02145 family)
MSPLKPRLIQTLLILFLFSGCAAGEKLPEPAEEITPTRTAVKYDGTVSDQEGNSYPILAIGQQVWMGANLKSTRDASGNLIGGVCFGDQDENCQIYGRLYNWEEAMNGDQGEGAQGICPAGWHIPRLDEWEVLINHLGGKAEAGSKLKQAGFEHWLRSNHVASNTSRMTILPTGWWDFTGEYRGLGEACFLRSSSSPDSDGVYVWEVRSSSSAVETGYIHPDDAIPLRCLKD